MIERKHNTWRLLGLIAIAGIVALGGTTRSSYAAQGAGRITEPIRSGVFVEAYPSKTLWVTTLDPGAVSDQLSQDVVQKLYAGLVKQAYDSRKGVFRIVPDLAQQLPAISNGGRTYTFVLRNNARFSDGTQVTAQDVAWSLNRALAPAEKSPIAGFYLGDIVGASDVVAGKAHTASGIKVVDRRTIQLTLDRPISYFLYAFTYPTSDVLKQNVPVGANMTSNPSLIVGAGPFMLKGQSWQYRKRISLVPNPYFYDARRVALQEVDLDFVGSAETAFEAYQSGQYPSAELPAIDVPQFRNTPAYRQTPVLGDIWYAMNLQMKPFNNRHFRRALAYAIDRRAIVDGVDRGTVAALYGWYPQGILGYDRSITNSVPHYDPAIARQELAAALQEIKTIPSGIQLEYASEDAGTGREVLQVQQDLRAIGITIGLHPVPQSTWLNDLMSHKTPFIVNGWVDDYPDPQDFSEYLLGTGGGGNYSNYSNPQVDALFARADIEPNVSIREKLYKQAQLLIMNDAPVIMAYQQAAQVVLSSKYHGITVNPSWGAFPQPANNDWTQVSVAR